MFSTPAIYNCFRKIIQPLDIAQLYNQVQQVGGIQDAIALLDFLNPDEEQEGQTENEPANEQEILEALQISSMQQGTLDRWLM